MADVKAIAETLVNLTVKEVQELATVLKDEYGIEPAAAAKGSAGPTAATAAAKGTAGPVKATTAAEGSTGSAKTTATGSAEAATRPAKGPATTAAK